MATVGLENRESPGTRFPLIFLVFVAVMAFVVERRVALRGGARSTRSKGGEGRGRVLLRVHPALVLVDTCDTAGCSRRRALLSFRAEI